MNKVSVFLTFAFPKPPTTLNSKPVKPVIIWLFSGCFLIFAMVVIGGITRLTESGLSIVEWDLVKGAFPPVNDQQWQETFEKYKQYPQYRELFSHYSLEDFKSIFWWEYIHRALGRLIGIVFLVPFLFFLFTKRLNNSLTKKLAIVFILGGLQGFLGWFMVKSGLVNVPRVSHYRLAAHLITAFLTFGYTFWIALDLIYGADKSQNQSLVNIRKLSVVFLAVLILQIVFGAFVAGMDAGSVHNTFPLMDGQLIPDVITEYSPLVAGLFETKSGVQLVHRLFALLIAAGAFAIWWKGTTIRLNPIQRTAVHLLVVVVLLQFALGVLTLLLHVPISFAVLHQAGAFLLFGVNVFLIHRLWYQ